MEDQSWYTNGRDYSANLWYNFQFLALAIFRFGDGCFQSLQGLSVKFLSHISMQILQIISLSPVGIPEHL